VFSNLLCSFAHRDSRGHFAVDLDIFMVAAGVLLEAPLEQVGKETGP
jgi:hypothetical protein